MLLQSPDKNIIDRCKHSRSIAHDIIAIILTLRHSGKLPRAPPGIVSPEMAATIADTISEYYNWFVGLTFLRILSLFFVSWVVPAPCSYPSVD